MSAPEPSDPRLTFARFLEDVARQYGERVAVVSDEAVVTYAEVEAKVRELARALIGAGVVKGAHVAIWIGNGPEWITAAYAAASVGAVVVPVNTFASPAERDHILRHSDASLLLLQPALGKHGFLDGLVADHPALASGVPGRLRVPELPQLRRVVCLGIPAARGATTSSANLRAVSRTAKCSSLRKGSIRVADSVARVASVMAAFGEAERRSVRWVARATGQRL